MHIHNSVSLTYANVNPTAAAEHATARQRAENVRKRLMSSANETDGVTSPDEANGITGLLDPPQRGMLEDDEYHPHHESRESDF
jgi:hypothetical protein